jgi:hypothetical protein
LLIAPSGAILVGKKQSLVELKNEDSQNLA